MTRPRRAVGRRRINVEALFGVLVPIGAAYAFQSTHRAGWRGTVELLGGRRRGEAVAVDASPGGCPASSGRTGRSPTSRRVPSSRAADDAAGLRSLMWCRAVMDDPAGPGCRVVDRAGPALGSVSSLAVSPDEQVHHEVDDRAACSAHRRSRCSSRRTSAAVPRRCSPSPHCSPRMGGGRSAKSATTAYRIPARSRRSSLGSKS